MNKYMLFLLCVLLFLPACWSKPCAPGTCLQTYDRCYSNGEYLGGWSCGQVSDITERQAATKDARYYCGDNDADRQLLRLNGTICEWSVEEQYQKCQEDKIKWPKDLNPDDCSKYKRPYKYTWPTWEEEYYSTHPTPQELKEWAETEERLEKWRQSK